LIAVLRFGRVESSRILALWLLLVIVGITVHLGGYPLLDADEGRNAEIARGMAESNDYLMPRINGLPYVDKPVVFFAIEALFMELLGPTEVAARLPALLFTLATAAVVFLFARRLWGGASPWVAAIVFLAMPFTVIFARVVIFDSTLTFFVVSGLVAFYLAVEERNRRWAALAWLAMGFAMITKGPVTFILVLFVALPYAWRRGGLRMMFPPAGILLFLLVVAPWVWSVTQIVPDFLHYVLVTETAERLTTPDLDRTGPFWYFLPYLLAGALPWSLAVLFSWRSIRKPDPAMFYLILWIVVPLLFFSLSQSKRPQYILPLMPAIALIVTRIWDEAKTRGAAIAMAALGGLLLVAPLFLHRTRIKPQIAPAADDAAIALGIMFAAGSLIALFTRKRELVLIGLTLPSISMPLLVNPLMAAIGETRSARSFVEELNPHLTPQTRVISVESYTGSLAFYLRRRMIVATDDASEFTSNYLVRRYELFSSDRRTMIRDPQYFQRTLADCCTPRVYIVRSRDRERRALLESLGWREVATSRQHTAYSNP
jgi:4-amino-4-deoxy-L-arabinose transferase-like glycosyltransferase